MFTFNLKKSFDAAQYRVAMNEHAAHHYGEKFTLLDQWICWLSGFFSSLSFAFSLENTNQQLVQQCNHNLITNVTSHKDHTMNYITSVRPLTTNEIDISLRVLVQLVKQFIECTFPAFNAEGWRTSQFVEVGYVLDTTSIIDIRFDHIVCYVQPGSSEGHIITVGLFKDRKKLSQFETLFEVKSIGMEHLNWLVAQAISEFMSTCLEKGLIPDSIPEITKKL